jgi:shikimate dehydrogenase
LSLRGVPQCIVINRTLERAQRLRDLSGAVRVPAVSVRSWDDWPHVAPRADLIINTTTLGMLGQPPLALDLSRVPDHALGNDIVYVPLETAFLAAAKARGLRGVDGLGMLLHQAVPGFEHWFGRRPQVTADLRALVAADIERRHQVQGEPS